MAHLVELTVTDMDETILLVDCPGLADDVARIARGWRMTRRDSDAPAPGLSEPWPLVRVEPGPGGFVVLSELRQLIAQSRVEALSGIFWHLVKALYLDRPEVIPVHAGSVRINGHLIAFAGASGMGKSTLTARLCAEPALTVFGDDIVLARPDGLGEAVGVLPRLRPPLPPAASESFRAYVETHSGPADALYQYVDAEIATLGTTAPLSALLLLDRRSEPTPAALVPVPEPERLRALVEATIATNASGMREHLRRLLRLADALPLYRLVYSGLDDVVGLLSDSAPEGLPFTPARLLPDLPPRPPRRWHRADGFAEEEIGGRLSLVRTSGFELVELNPMARALLFLVEAGLDEAEMLDLLAAAYPDIPRAALEADCARTLADFARHGVILPAS